MTVQERDAILQYAANISAALQNAMTDEDHPDHFEINEETITEFFHALANVVPANFFNKITGEDKNYLEFNQTANSLCFQYSTKKD